MKREFVYLSLEATGPTWQDSFGAWLRLTTSAMCGYFISIDMQYSFPNYLIEMIPICHYFHAESEIGEIRGKILSQHKKFDFKITYPRPLGDIYALCPLSLAEAFNTKFN